MKKLIVGILLLLFGAFLAYLFYGFLKPDPFFLYQMSLKLKIIYLWIPRIIIPLFLISLVYVYLKWSKKIFGNYLLILATFFVLFLIIYPFGDARYYRQQINRFKQTTKEMHAILQLAPNHHQDSIKPVADNVTKIFCIGGSTTAFTDDNGIGWPERLQHILNQSGEGDSVVVYNFGRSWYTTLHTLINYETNLRQYKPDVIIIMQAVNDLLVNADFSYLSKGYFRSDYGHFYGPVSFIYENTGFFGSHWQHIKNMWYHQPREVYTQSDFPGLVSFEHNLNNLIDLAEQDSIKVIIMSQPNIYAENMSDAVKDECWMINFEAVGKNKQWSYETGLNGMNAYNYKLKEIARKRGTYFFDLEKEIPKDLDHFSDEVHYRGDSFDMIGKAVAGFIENAGVLDQVNDR